MNVDAFDAIQLKTIQNVVFMTEHDFGASEQNKKFYRKYIDKTADEMLELAIRIHSLCKYANSIYPESMAQWNERIEAEKKALASVWALTSQYHSILYILDVDENKYVNHIKKLKGQSGSIKNWINHDKKAYKNRDWWTA